MLLCELEETDFVRYSEMQRLKCMSIRTIFFQLVHIGEVVWGQYLVCYLGLNFTPEHEKTVKFLKVVSARMEIPCTSHLLLIFLFQPIVSVCISFDTRDIMFPSLSFTGKALTNPCLQLGKSWWTDNYPTGYLVITRHWAYAAEACLYALLYLILSHPDLDHYD